MIRRRSNGGAPVGELGYEPALDGLRAVAVLAVLVFHARFSWAPGGFLGVSTFFTLSGFLITTLLIQEWRRAGGVSLRGFFGRRFRRLLPASWFTMLAVLVMGALGVWATDQMRSLRGDVPWALAELVNWHFIIAGRTYGAQFEAPSPLEHYWSLAIEQQFYLILPLLVLGVMGWSQRRALAHGRGSGGPRTTPLRPLVAILCAAAVVSWYLNWRLAADSTARSYFGTDTRLAELAIGALLATVGVPRLRGVRPGIRRSLMVLGIIGLVASAALWSTATVGSRWLYPWGLMLTTASSTAMIAGSLHPGPLRRLFELAPLVALGRISYGVYLLHWPVFLWLTPARTGLSQWPLFGLRMAVTLSAAVVMFNVLETPIRRGSRIVVRVSGAFLAPSAIALLVITALVTADLPEPSQLAAASESPTTTTTIPPAPFRVLVVGDHLAEQWEKLDTAGEPVSAGSAAPVTVPGSGAPLEVTVAAARDCGVALGGFVRLPDGTIERDTDRCGPVQDAWVDAMEDTRPDVVLVWSAVRDVADRRLDTTLPWSAPGDPGLDDFLSVELREMVQRMSAGGAGVLLGTSPHFESTLEDPPPVARVLPSDPVRRPLAEQAYEDAARDVPPPGRAENDPVRIDRWNELLSAASQDAGAGVVDLAGMMAGWQGGEFAEGMRASDGVGLTPLGIEALAESAAEVIEQARAPVERADPTAEVAAEAPLPPAPPYQPRRTAAAGTGVRILVVGDSVAYNVGYGLLEWSEGQRGVRVHNAGQLGCAVARGGQYRFLRDIDTFEDRCDWAGMFAEWVSGTDLDVVVLTSGIWEVVDRRLPGDDRFRHIGQESVDRYILAEFLSAIDTLAARGATVVLLTYPHFEAGRDQGYADLPESDPARVDRLNELMVQAVSLRPGVATLVDFQGWLAAQPGGELDPTKREDGLHFYDSYSPAIGAWLGPQLIERAREGLPVPADG